MKRKFSIAMSLAVVMAMCLNSLALAAVSPAHIVFTADAPCAVTVIVTSYTDPANQPGQTASDSTPWTLDVYPSTSVTFLYPAFVVCGGTTYNFGSASPGSPLTSGNPYSTTTVIGHYTQVVIDNTPPVWNVPASFSVEATGPGGAVVTYSASASDPDDAVNSQSCSPASGSTFPLGSTTVSCTATDTHGNTGTASFSLTVVDTTPPALTLPGNMTVNAPGAAGIAVNFTASAIDLVNGSVPVTCLPTSGSTFPIGMTTVHCLASDSHNNTANGSFTVTVTNVVTDTTPPVWNVPASFSVEATSPSGAIVTYSASASDPDDAVTSQSCLPASGSIFNLGTATVNCTATDTHGNTGTASFNVTVVDTTLPALALPSNMTVNATSSSGATVNFTVSATDLVDGSVPVTCSSNSGSTFPMGVTTVHCSATDAHTHTANGSFTITVINANDATPPVWKVPANLIVEATGPTGAIVNYIASATDPDDAVSSQSCLPASGTVFPLGTTTVTCTATDMHGNTGTAQFTVTIVDTTAPALKLPVNLIVTALKASGTPVKFVFYANDLVDGPVPVTCSPASGSVFPIGATIVNCSAMDSHGNNASAHFTVFVQYAPVGAKCGGVAGHQVLAPINIDGSSVFKQGSVVPVKFRVCDTNGKAIGTPGVVSKFRLIEIISKAMVLNVDQPVLSAASDPVFRSGNQQWIFNINTRNLKAGSTYVYLITLIDGSTIQFQFSLK